MEFISWAVDGKKGIWIFFDIVNNLRGLLIFYLCVISNAKVRRAILTRLCKKAAGFGTNNSNTNQSDVNTESKSAENAF
jgi:hypothetical protein